MKNILQYWGKQNENAINEYQKKIMQWWKNYKFSLKIKIENILFTKKIFIKNDGGMGEKELQYNNNDDSIQSIIDIEEHLIEARKIVHGRYSNN